MNLEETLADLKIDMSVCDEYHTIIALALDDIDISSIVKVTSDIPIGIEEGIYHTSRGWLVKGVGKVWIKRVKYVSTDYRYLCSLGKYVTVYNNRNEIIVAPISGQDWYSNDDVFEMTNNGEMFIEDTVYIPKHLDDVFEVGGYDIYSEHGELIVKKEEFVKGNVSKYYGTICRRISTIIAYYLKELYAITNLNTFDLSGFENIDNKKKNDIMDVVHDMLLSFKDRFKRNPHSVIEVSEMNNTVVIKLGIDVRLYDWYMNKNKLKNKGGSYEDICDRCRGAKIYNDECH